MNRSNKYYPPRFIMRTKDPDTRRIIDLWTFRSTKSRKRYIVEVEHFKDYFLGIKFYWKGANLSVERYSLMTNDYEPRTIVRSCIRVMFDYFTKDDRTSFGFVGAHDLVELPKCDFPNKRFRFYRRMMLSLFGPETFVQLNDVKNPLYFLVRRNRYDSGEVTMEKIEQELSEMYEGDYNLVLAE